MGVRQYNLKVGHSDLLLFRDTPLPKVELGTCIKIWHSKVGHINVHMKKAELYWT